jgi:mRNA interferase RelE/StbE
MSYSIKWQPQSSNFLYGLQKNIAERILKKLDEVKENPFRYLKHYEGDEGYKLRIGDYRALVDIDFQNRILFIMVLDKRGRIYKR